jgi:hypothetical protein
MSSSVTIKCQRKSSLLRGCVNLDVLVDGQKIGTIANGEERTFEVEYGKHVVQVAHKVLHVWGSESIGSQLIHVDLSPNSSTKLECGTSSDWLRTLTIAVGMLLCVPLLVRTFFPHNSLGPLTLDLTWVTLGVAVFGWWGIYARFKPLKFRDQFYLKSTDDQPGGR